MLYGLALLALNGCGASNVATVGDGNPGKVTVKVVQSSADVTTTRLIITGPQIPTARQDFIGGTGGTTEVYPGNNLIVTAQALKSDGTIAYEGYKSNITVIAGANPFINISTVAPVVKQENVKCQACHESTRDITGQNLLASYKQSGHYRDLSWTFNPKNGSILPGCAGCHGTQHNDTAPSASGRCFECHSENLSLKHKGNVVGASNSALIAGEANAARYLNLNGTNCSACHEPHNPINGTGKLQREQWEESGHAKLNGMAWSHYDFTIRDTCNSCHTAAGFAKAVNNNFTNKTAISTTVTQGKQVLTCDACHSSNDFKNSVRPLSTGYVVPYTTNASTATASEIPNGGFIGNSQVCIPCHSGLNGGKIVENYAGNMTTTTFGTFNSHYMAVAGLMYAKNGFTAFTSASAPVKINDVAVTTSAGASTNPLFAAGGVFRKYTSIPKGYQYTYGNSLTSTSDGGAVSSTHRILGTDAIKFDTHTDAAGAKTASLTMTTRGPCLSCHMGNANHTWEINADSYNKACINCHSAEATATTIKTGFVEEQSEPFKNAVAFALSLLKTNYGIEYDASLYPYFYVANSDHTLSSSQFKDWTKGGTLTTAQAKKLAGACFNINLVSREPAAFVHARTYVRRLLYDSIDFLDDGKINMSVTASAGAYNSTLYNTSAATAATATTSLQYLKAYNRTSNAWYSSERP